MWLDLIQYIVWNIFSKVGFNSVQNTGKWLDFSFFPTLFSQDEGGCWQWMYEGRNGWWLYDERTSQEIEKSFKNNELRCELLIAGFLYIVGKLALIKWVLSKSFCQISSTCCSTGGTTRADGGRSRETPPLLPRREWPGWGWRPGRRRTSPLLSTLSTSTVILSVMNTTNTRNNSLRISLYSLVFELWWSSW